MLLLHYAGLQLEVCKHIVPAARREELGCRSYSVREEVAGRQVRAEVAQISGCSEKKYLRRGASAKRPFSEE